MKKKLQKISIVVAAIVLFVGAMLLNVKKNDHGQWKVATVSSFAQGGESGGGSIVQVYHYDLKTITAGVPDFANGRAHLFPNPGGSAAGIAVVTSQSYELRNYLYTKANDNSLVGWNAGLIAFID